MGGASRQRQSCPASLLLVMRQAQMNHVAFRLVKGEGTAHISINNKKETPEVTLSKKD